LAALLREGGYRAQHQ